MSEPECIVINGVKYFRAVVDPESGEPIALKSESEKTTGMLSPECEEELWHWEIESYKAGSADKPLAGLYRVEFDDESRKTRTFLTHVPVDISQPALHALLIYGQDQYHAGRVAGEESLQSRLRSLLDIKG